MWGTPIVGSIDDGTEFLFYDPKFFSIFQAIGVVYVMDYRTPEKLVDFIKDSVNVEKHLIRTNNLKTLFPSMV